MNLNRIFSFLLLSVIIVSCNSRPSPFETLHEEQEEVEEVELAKPDPIEFGFKLNDYLVIRDTVRRGETFGKIMDKNHVYYPTIHKVIQAAKDTLDVRRIQLNNPYTILAKKDSTEAAQVFIYKVSNIEYKVIDFSNDTLIKAYTHFKPVRKSIRHASGVIEKNKSLIETLMELDLDPNLAYYLADDIYAWTLDFTKLYPGDKFKIIYEEKFLDDGTYVGVGKIKAAYVEHAGEDHYAFRFIEDPKKNFVDFYDESNNNLRRAFLKSPIKFNYRVSSRYNLKRKIALYGRVKAHKGTDFAAPVGTPIMSTANGVVVESRYKTGNGNYVKIKHNNTYTTQYLHMKKRGVKVGDYVKQGDVIGWVGMTGYTSGPHVCYRFWKNGRQVDPFKQKLPSAEPMKKEAIPRYDSIVQPLKQTLDQLNYPEMIADYQASLVN